MRGCLGRMGAGGLGGWGFSSRFSLSIWRMGGCVG